MLLANAATTTNYLYVVSSSGSVVATSSLTTIPNGTATTTFDFNAVLPAGDYKFTLDIGAITAYGKLTTNPYADGCTFRGYLASSTPSCSGNNNDLYFQIFGAPPAPVVSINFPANEGTTPDFDIWQVGYNYIDANTPYAVAVCYDQSQSAVTGCFDNATTSLSNDAAIIQSWENGGSGQKNVLKAWPLLSLASSTIDYYAMAGLYDIGGNLLATSSEMTFGLIGGSQVIVDQSFYQTPTSTGATSSEFVIDCATGNLLTNSICSMLQWLFVPKRDDFGQFSDLALNIKNKVPIGYLPLISAQWDNLQNATTTAGDIQGLDILTLPLRAGFAWLLWLGFCGLIFFRIKHFEL